MILLCKIEGFSHLIVIYLCMWCCSYFASGGIIVTVVVLSRNICVSNINSCDCCINVTIQCSWFVEGIVLRYLKLFFVFAFIFVLLMFIIWSCSLLFLLRLTHMINVIYWYLFSPLESKFWNFINWSFKIYFSNQYCCWICTWNWI